jgi:hypothetical protein
MYNKCEHYKTAKIKYSGEVVAIQFVGVDNKSNEALYRIRTCWSADFGNIIYFASELMDFVL